MNILAVIPARAGSKGIPNKNIRIIDGFPLVYYAINNGLQSKYINKVVVTTDSHEVAIIAKCMGVACHWREKYLCEDAVTLDAVIANAIPLDVKWDYIVTLQPTSPTLSVTTLDNAIYDAVERDLDTLISAINKPHLSWGEKDGKKVPNFTERLNRQYLPPYYVETGAFVISKASVVTPQSRIGKKIDLFEISEDESLDIDSFTDLEMVEIAMKRIKVAIYVNGNNKRGMGHIYRALELADEFYTKPDIYYDINQTDVAVFGVTTHKLIPVNGIVELYEYCRKEQYTFFINDILSTSLDYMIALRTVLPDAKIINFEDDGEGAIKADLVFNALYNKSELPYVYVGEKYYISAKLFMLYSPITIKPKVRKVFICFGGADPQNYTDRVLEIILRPEYSSFEFCVVLGRAKENVESLMEYNQFSNIQIFYDVVNMPELMSGCDMAITSRGRTGYELAILGIPSIVIAQNRREEKHGFACNENGFTYIGLNPADEIIEANIKMYLGLSQESRQRFQDMLLSHDLRNGRKRVMKLINDL